MNCKEYLFIAHHGFTISYDDEESLAEIPADLKQRGTNAYTVKKDDYASFERSMNVEPNFDLPQANASGLSGPQGTKGTYLGIDFDSKWEYVFYRYQTDVKGHVVTRNHSEWYPYYDERGRERKFYYDFDDMGQPTEIKGIWRASDLLKQQATSGLVVFLTGDDIKPMIKELNDKVPNWENDFVTR